MDDNTAPLPTAPVGMGGGVPDVGPQQAPQVQQAPPQPSPQDIETQHSTLFGRAAKALMGDSTSYHVDQNGNTVAVNSPQTFNSLARNILSASILGAAAGANGNPAQGLMGGVVRGGAAGIQQGQQQDLLKRQQAEQEFKNQEAASQDKRESDAAASTEKLRTAQIANAQAETLRTQQLTLGSDLKMHDDVAAAGKQHVSDYDNAGLKPVFKDIPETEMQQTIANRPGASAFDWEPTGVKVGLDAKGQPTHEYTYSAYDPKGQVPVSQGTIDQWKKDGMDKFYPELFDVVKAGKPLDASQYIELKRTDTKLYNDNLVRQKNDQTTEQATANLRHVNAETAASLATAVHQRTETGMLQMEKTKQQALSNAFEELNKADGDFDKLTPKSQLIIGQSQAALLPSMETEYKAALADGDQDHAKEVLSQMTSIRSLSAQAIHHGSAAAPAAGGSNFTTADGRQFHGIPKDKVADFLKLHPDAKPLGSPAAPQIAKQDNSDRLSENIKNTLTSPLIN